MQRIRKLIVKNIGPINRELEVDFDVDSPLTIIKGANGIGKSTLLKSMTALQTGYFPDATLGEILNKHANRGFIQGEFVDDEGNVYTRYQGLGADKKRLLTLPDGTEITKDREIKNYLYSYFGCSADTLMKTVFVTQGSLANIVASDRMDRVKTIAELSGVNNAEQIWSSLGKKIGSFNLDPAIPGRFSECQQELEDSKEALAKAQEACDSLEELESTRDLYRVIDAYQAMLVATKEKEDLKQSILPQLQSKEDYQGRLVAKISERDTIEFPCTDEEVEKLRVNIRDYDKAQMFLQERKGMEELKAKLAAWREKNPSRPDIQVPDISELEELLYDAKSTKKSCDRDLESLADGVCHACGQEIPNAKAEIQKKTKKRDGLAEVIEKMTKKLEAKRLKKQEVEEALAKYDRLYEKYKMQKAQVDAYFEKLSSIDVVSKEEYEKALQTTVAYEKTLEQKKAIDDVIAEYNKEINNLCASISSTESKIEERETVINNAPSKSEAENAKFKIAQIAELEEKHREAKASLAVAKSRYEDISKRYEQAEEAYNRYRKDQDVVEKLTYLRELFHRDNLPAQVSKAFIREVANRANEYMVSFESDFMLEGDMEDMGFLSTYADGKVLKLHQESGGWSVVTSLCLRCAISDLISANMKSIVLDESIIYLDTDNLARVPMVLEKIKAVNRTLGKQMILVTHEPTILPVADTVITL